MRKADQHGTEDRRCESDWGYGEKGQSEGTWTCGMKGLRVKGRARGHGHVE